MKRRFVKKENILLVNITRLGDMLQATPTIAGLKMENPNCKITVLVEKQFEDVCHCIPNIDEIMSLDLAMTCRCLAREQDGIIEAYEYISDVVRDLRARNFDYCLNMSSSAYTALLLKLVDIKRSGGWTSDDEGFRVIQSDWARLFATSVFHQNRQYNSLNLVDVFRCSADVEQHPPKLLISVHDEDLAHADKLIAEAGFTNTGPLICLQAGASQGKRQWAPAHFIKLAKILVEKHNARVVLTGSNKERDILDPIKFGVNSPNVVSFAGKTNIPQLAAVLQRGAVLITGDTGPMHIGVAVGTPIVAMFLASAYAYETGPYSAGNLIVQPLISCGPCNPNKPCARPDCHDQIDPELIAELTVLRMKGDVIEIPPGLADPRRVVVYRSEFDQFGFLDLRPLNSPENDSCRYHRQAYRQVWLEELGGFVLPSPPVKVKRSLTIAREPLEGFEDVLTYAGQGKKLVEQLITLIKDPLSPPKKLGDITAQLSMIDREIEQKGFRYAGLGPLTRMFIFAKENLSGSEALDLASQMGGIYEDLDTRARKISKYYQDVE